MDDTVSITMIDTAHYRISRNMEKDSLILDWHRVNGLKPEDFRTGILDFARHCDTHSPAHAVIDATDLDQDSPAVAWLRGQPVNGEVEDYNGWWLQSVVPLYNGAGIQSLAVGTGDPSAPGELRNLPTTVNFRVAYLPDINSALHWGS